MQCSCTLKDVWFGFFHSLGQLNSTQLRQWRLCISSMVQRLAEHLGMPPQSQKLTVSHTHSRCVSPSLATEAWARTGRSAPLTFCVSGRQNSHSVEGNRGGRVCSQLLWTWEPAERLLGALYLCKSLRLQSSNLPRTTFLLWLKFNYRIILGTWSRHLLCVKERVLLAFFHPSAWCQGLWTILAVILCKLSCFSFRY